MSGPGRRILLALDADDAAALEAALALARALSASLEALFIEDADLLRLATLPIAREVGYGSAALRPLDLARLERELRARAAAVLQRLQREAGVEPTWSFGVVRGSLAAVRRRPEPPDLFVLGRRGLQREQHPTGDAFAILVDGSAAGRAGLEAALHLADNRPLLLLPIGADGSRELDAYILPRLATDGLRATVIPLQRATPEAISQALRSRRVAALFIGDAPPFDDWNELNRLAARVDLPIVVAAAP